MSTVEAVLCACGCGQPVPLSKKTYRAIVKGQQLTWIHGHNRRKHPHDEPVSHRRRRQRYGLEPGDVEDMLIEQNHKCANQRCRAAIYRGSPIDHDHETGRIRGMLCDLCNKALGQARDCPEVLRGLAEYLEDQPSR